MANLAEIEATKNAWRAAGLTDDDISALPPTDFGKLFAAGYTNGALIKRAAREGLRDAGLSSASIDFLLDILAQKGEPGFPIPSSCLPANPRGWAT